MPPGSDFAGQRQLGENLRDFALAVPFQPFIVDMTDQAFDPPDVGVLSRLRVMQHTHRDRSCRITSGSSESINPLFPSPATSEFPSAPSAANFSRRAISPSFSLMG